jgi:uncharacterized protein with ParB-like and HNH nuclease domain
MNETVYNELSSLEDIFNGENFFQIPDYQRGYAWEKKHVIDMLEDIKYLATDESDMKHYAGTIVITQSERSDNCVFDIVDGQQRLTTLTILLYILSQKGIPKKNEKFVQQYLIGGEVGNYKHRLKLNSDTNRFFEKRVVPRAGDEIMDEIEFESHQRLLSARETIDEWLKKEEDNVLDLSRFLNSVTKELGFLVFSPKATEETGAMFEVINNRGKGLSELEKVKNYLIYYSVKARANSSRENINRSWGNILKNLSKAKKTSDSDEDSFLRYCMIVFFGASKETSQDGYESLKQDEFNIRTYNNSSEVDKELYLTKLDKFLQFLESASIWYRRLYGSDYGQIDLTLHTVLTQIASQHRQASILPLFLAVVIKFSNSRISLESTLKLLQLIEILNFRVNLARGIISRHDSGQAELFKYATDFYKSSDVVDLIKKLKEFVESNSPDIKFENSFILADDDDFDFYRWEGLKYFLMNYEGELQPKRTIDISKILNEREKGKGNDYYSVEHIWATENGSEKSNRGLAHYEKRRLGNFTLLELSINSSLRHADISDKMERLGAQKSGSDKSNLAMVQKMIDVANESIVELSKKYKTKNYPKYLAKAINDKRECELIEFANKRWGLDNFKGQ